MFPSDAAILMILMLLIGGIGLSHYVRDTEDDYKVKFIKAGKFCLESEVVDVKFKRCYKIVEDKKNEVKSDDTIRWLIR